MKTLNVISFGAGVQSTTLVLMAIHGLIARPDAVIFADTQSEPQWVYETLKWVAQACAEAELPLERGRLAA